MTDSRPDRKFANTLARGPGVLRACADGLTCTLCEQGCLNLGGCKHRFRLRLSAAALGSVATLLISFVRRASVVKQRLADDTGTLALIAVRTVNAASVPYFAKEIGVFPALTCGARPNDPPEVRIVAKVGPALRDAVRAFEKQTGHAPALVRRG